MSHDDGDPGCFVVSYTPGCLGALPWRDEKFDCLLFNFDNSSLMEEAVDELLDKNCRWIHTAGHDAQYWHDYTDRRWEILGRYAAGNEAPPRTAWHKEVNDFLNLRLTLNFGGSAYFLIVLVGLEEIQGFMNALKKVNRDRFQSLKGMGVKSPRFPHMS